MREKARAQGARNEKDDDAHHRHDVERCKRAKSIHGARRGVGGGEANAAEHEGG